MAAPKPPPRVAKKAPPPKKPVEPPDKKAETVAAPVVPRTTSAEMPFLPVIQMPTNSDAVLNNLMAREMVHPSGPPETGGRNVELLQALAVGMRDGNIGPVKEALTRIGAHQVEKAQIIDTVLNEDNFERTANWMEIRYNTENVIKRCSRRGDMTTSEATVLWRISHDALSECFARLEKTKPIDSATVVEKVDIRVKDAEQAVRKKWEGTSPQGREIIRKKLHLLKKQVKELKRQATAVPAEK